MKAFILDKFKNGALSFGDMPEPLLQHDDVLVEIHAAGLNLLDSKIHSGEFKPILPYRSPLILGHDLAGTVGRVGTFAEF
jgi:NADPH:quinone reductase-like Zn-dependent oxidoreductase